MAKKSRKSSSSSFSHYRHANWIRFLAAIGAAVSLVFRIVAIALELIPKASIPGIIFAILGIIVDLIILGSLNLINHNFVVKMTWFSLLVLGVLDAIFFALSAAGFGYGYLGTLCIIIAALIGIFDRL